MSRLQKTELNLLLLPENLGGDKIFPSKIIQVRAGMAVLLHGVVIENFDLSLLFMFMWLTKNISTDYVLNQISRINDEKFSVLDASKDEDVILDKMLRFKNV